MNLEEQKEFISSLLNYKESIDSKVTYELIDKNNKGIAKGKSDRAGLEVIEKIFEYF